MTAAEGSRKLLCQCGKPLGVFEARGLRLYCRFSKETTTVPYGLGGLGQAIAYVEARRRQGRSSEPGRGV